MTTTDHLEKWFNLNVDLTSRTIYLGSQGHDDDSQEVGTDYRMAEFFIKGMHSLEQRNKKPITILMNNPGGDWYHGMAIYDAIQQSKCHCTIQVYGQAMSMGCVILQAADHRVLMPNSRIMIHYGQAGHIDSSKNFQNWASESRLLDKKMEQILLDRILEKEEISGAGQLEKTFYHYIKTHPDRSWPSQYANRLWFSSQPKAFKEQALIVLQQLLSFDTILDAETTINFGLADSIYRAE